MTCKLLGNVSPAAGSRDAQGCKCGLCVEIPEGRTLAQPSSHGRLSDDGHVTHAMSSVQLEGRTLVQASGHGRLSDDGRVTHAMSSVQLEGRTLAHASGHGRLSDDGCRLIAWSLY